MKKIYWPDVLDVLAMMLIPGLMAEGFAKTIDDPSPWVWIASALIGAGILIHQKRRNKKR